MSDEMFFFATCFRNFNFTVLGEEGASYILGIFEKCE